MPVSAPFRVAFRADASLQIGTGHVMRCLTLADHLRDLGAETIFLARPHAGNLLDLVDQRGHIALALPAREPVEATSPEDPVHSSWLGGTWNEDAQSCIHTLKQHLNGTCVDWLVVDHYALDVRWEISMRSVCRKILAIDDLADRRHDCDVLLDQNLGRTVADYRGLAPDQALLLIGPHFALLRPEFGRLRETSLSRRTEPEIKRLLITMGGVDRDNATGLILEALSQVALPPDMTIDVVLGPHAPWLEHVRAKARKTGRPTQVLAGVDNMAHLMCGSDLAIGAAGSTSWERCCLGLPSITLILAENQTEIANALQRSDATILAKSVDAISGLLKRHFYSSDALKTLSDLGRHAALICDGNGAERVANHLKIG